VQCLAISPLGQWTMDLTEKCAPRPETLAAAAAVFFSNFKVPCDWRIAAFPWTEGARANPRQGTHVGHVLGGSIC
jgi:hypothetical protein